MKEQWPRWLQDFNKKCVAVGSICFVPIQTTVRGKGLYCLSAVLCYIVASLSLMCYRGDLSLSDMPTLMAVVSL